MSEPKPEEIVLESIHFKAYGLDQESARLVERSLLQEVVKTERLLDGAAIDTLHALMKAGPLFDGDVPSKRGRDMLAENGLAARIVVKGEDGYNAATHWGAMIYRFHNKLRELEHSGDKTDK